MLRGLLIALLLVGSSASLFGVKSGYQPMTIVRAELKTRDRVVAWVVDTPIYQQDSYFEVAVRTGDLLLEGEYEPRGRWESLPIAWKPGAAVQGRVEKHSLYLKRPDGTEMRFVVLKRSAPRVDKADAEKAQ